MSSEYASVSILIDSLPSSLFLRRVSDILRALFARTSTAAITSSDTCWICEAASADSLASLLISSATTANPLPASPALAASIEALRESRLVWLEILIISSTRLLIFSTFLASSILSLSWSTSTFVRSSLLSRLDMAPSAMSVTFFIICLEDSD